MKLSYFVIGIGVGLCLGAALHNVGAGIAMGVGLGAAFGVLGK